MRVRFIFLVILACVVCGVPTLSLAQSSVDSQIDANNDILEKIQEKINSYEKQLKALGGEKKTLQDAINALTLTQQKLTAEISATQTKISSATLEIQKLSRSIEDKEDAILENQQAIAKALRSVAEGDQSSLVTELISANSFTEVWEAADEAVQFNRALSREIQDLRAARTTLKTNRDAVSAAKAKLVSLQDDLTRQKRSVTASKTEQQDLLTQTKNQESSYQKLLAAAKAELASFSAFTTNAGGSKLLANQTSCDAWGCYYSQRDTLWGNMPLNGTKYRLASDGCLVTSMAMVLTHYGYRDVTPVTINSNPSNFASYFPAYLLFTIQVDGVTATRKAATIDAILATGHPVVVGVRAYGGTHFVVLTKGSKGSYLMRDPYIANGKDINFTTHYSVASIFGISKVIITKG